jgi:hypothetical protein
VPPTSRSATIETDLFEHRTPKDDFINPCCFGEDFAAWLQVRLSGLTEFKLGAPVMEDYGWGFGASHAKGSIWVALSFAHEGPVEGPASWGVSVEWRDAKLLSRWLGKPDLTAFDPFVDAVWAALKAEPAITFTPD